MLNELNFLFNNSNISILFDNNGVAWFKAYEIANALGYSSVHDMIRHLPDQERSCKLDRTLGGLQQIAIINEYGLYRIIMRATAKKPEVKALQGKVFYDILPCIRKYGAYIDSNTRIQLETNSNLIHDLNRKIENHEKKQMCHIIDKSKYPYNNYETLKNEIPELRIERDNLINRLAYLEKTSFNPISIFLDNGE